MSPRRVFLFLYLLSGATALLYQVAWSRALTLEMGHTAAAVSTVLAAFMGGLALGAWIGGRAAVRLDHVRALTWYARLELLVAAAALLVAPALGLASYPLALTYRDGEGGFPFALLRLATSLLVVFVPATAMGATLPFAVRWLEAVSRGTPGRLAGALYAMNTLGAAFGASVTGFVLLPALGLRWTTMVGVATNGAVALAAWRLARTPVAAAPESARAAESKRPHKRSKRAQSHAAARPIAASIALALSGVAALIHEVAWTRVLALVIGPTTYAFTMMVAVFILGLAAGGALGTRLLRGARGSLSMLAWAQVAVAAGALAAAACVPRLPLIVAALVAPTGDQRYASVLLREALLVLVLLLPMTVALGASFPLAVALADAGDESAAKPTARVYAWNTIGAIAGALAGGFVLLPRLGLQATVIAAVAVALAVAAWLAFLVEGPRSRRFAIGAVCALLAWAGWRMPPWSETLLAAGLYRQATQASFDPHVELSAGTLLYYGDGPTGTVSVRQVAGEVSLAINGKVDASDAGDMLTQKLLAHLPLLLHPAPRDVCIIGLGSGVTAGAALAHPIRAVDTVELSPEVVQASRFFDRVSGRPLNDPRSRLVVGDGRTHLRLGQRLYDAIISEPSNPWMAGVASLFTREFFAATRDRLRPGGVFCQWAHTYQMSEPDLASIVKTFLTAFPDGSLWLVGDADVLLIGTRDGDLAARLDQLERRWTASPTAVTDLASVEVRDAASLLALHVTGGRRLAGFASQARVQSDDRTALEFSAPLTLYGRTGAALLDRLRALASADGQQPAVVAARSTTNPGSWQRRAAMFLAAEAYGPAFDAAARALALDPASPAVDVLVKAAMPLGKGDEAVALLTRTIAVRPEAVLPRVGLSRLQATRGELEPAVRTAFEATRASPDDVRAWEQLASVLGDVGDVERLAPAVAELERRAPAGWAAAYYSGTAAFLQGRFAEAARLGEQAAARKSGDGRALNLVGAARASLGDRDGARRAFASSLERDARDPATYLNLARLELDSANPGRAAALFSDALILDPSSTSAREGLDQARSLLR